MAWAFLALMAAILFAGTWNAHPVPSLVVPAVALFVWRPVIRAKRAERWLLFYVVGIYIYTILRAFADDLGPPARASYAINFDRLLFGGSLPSAELQRAFFRPSTLGWVDVGAAFVHASFFIAPHAALAFVWWKWPNALRPCVLSALLTLWVGLALFFLVPTVPPWLAAYDADAGRVYRVIDFVFHGANLGAYGELREALAEPNSVAAMPSIHMALTCVVLFRAQALASRWVWPIAVYVVLMAASLVYLGEHYVLDVTVGFLLAAACEYVVRRLEARRRPPQQSTMLPQAV